MIEPAAPLPAAGLAAGVQPPRRPPQAEGPDTGAWPADCVWCPADAARPEAWRNGGGSTRTLLTWPPGTGTAGPWQLRISLADIHQDGPFSAFAGVQRWFAVVQGGGVRLQPPSAPGQGTAPPALCLRPDSPAHGFDGAQPPDCQLLDGPTRDLNLMLRGLNGGLATAQAGQAWQPPAGAWWAVLVDGPATLGCGPQRFTLPGLGLLHAPLPPPWPSPPNAASAEAWQLIPTDGGARAWWVWAHLRPAAPAASAAAFVPSAAPGP